MNPSSFSPLNNSFSIAIAAGAYANYSSQMPNPGPVAQPGMQVQALLMALQEIIQVSQGLQMAWGAVLAGSFQGQMTGPQLQPNFPPQFGAAVPYGGAAQFGGAGQFAGAAQFAGAGQYAGAGQFGGAGQYGGMQFGYGYPQSYGDASQAAGGYANLNLDFGYQQLPGQSQKMWDVWFDSKEGQKTVQRSPIVLDLNKNGKADITGKNITGDGKIDGPTTLFDLDPNSVSYEFKSQQRRPGSGAPAVDGGHWVDSNGNAVKNGPPKGTQAKFNGFKYLDKNGAVVGEMKDGLYNYGKQEKREATEWLAKDGGDGFLVADLNGDGQINSAVELFGTAGSDGAKYQNGYEKLAALYDKNHDGRVNGEELNGLKVWADANADGQVQQGELQSLQQHNITNFNVGDYNAASMESSYTVGGQMAPYLNLNGNMGLFGYGQQTYFSPNPYFPGYPQARPGAYGPFY
ncbi:hypothetical protein IV102_06135 [bacterium]|nr:hypothetical protein [bacterium]